MIIIADASPINYLILINAIDILPNLYDQIIIPEGVFGELNVASALSKVRMWLDSRPSWLEIRTLTKPVDSMLVEQLDTGESEAIQLASDLKADLLVIGERLGR